jgi:hypothetical protein
MKTGFGFALWQKRFGMLAMVLLAAALLSLADALIGGIRGGSGPIALTPGVQYAISGPLPPRTESIKQFVITGQPEDSSVRLVPETIYSGYWFGGSMWRGHIVVDSSAQEGDHVISVKDSYGEKQNPTLVFTVRIWPDQATLNANSPSRLIRWTGTNPFLVAFFLTLAGMVAGAANFVFGRLWARQLQTHHCGEIFRLRTAEIGTEATCELRSDDAIQPGMDGTIYRPSGERICTARVTGYENGEVLLLINQPGCVRLGDVACVHTVPTQGSFIEGRCTA